VKIVATTLLFCLSIVVAKAQVQAVRKTVLPVPPPELLKLLPVAPRDWQIKESKAKSFYNESLVSQANRQIIGPLPPASVNAPAGTQASPPMTRLRLTDTAFVPALYADFEGFKPGKYGNTESLYVDTLPARNITLKDGDRLRILVKGRFVIEVETHNQAPNAAIAWARQFDVTKISAIPDSVVAKLPNPVTVVSIDELNPKANSSYQVNWSTQEDLDAARKRKP
jgi:hypothetical protein